MYLNITGKEGHEHLYLNEKISYKDPVTGKRKHTNRTVEALGSLEDLKKIYDDPIAHFREVAKQRTAEKKKSSTVSIEIDLNETMDVDEDNLKNVGYGILKQLYKDLEIDKFWNWKT